MRILTAGDRLGTAVIGLLTFASLFRCDGLQAQMAGVAKGQVRVPLVGCKSDGQVGLLEAPESGTISVSISRKSAQTLAYYKAASGVGVLAPRGWHCFGTYGSAIDTLSVSAEPINASGRVSGTKDLNGSAVQLRYISGDGPGSISVAEIIARVFPAYRSRAVHAVSGVVILVGQAQDLLHLSLRLPAAMAQYSSAIIKQLEFDAVNLKSE
jgi:hypothetical protein